MSTIIITVDSRERDRQFASTVQATRRHLGVTIAALAKASGLARPSIEAIEKGGTATRADRRDISAALSRLSRQPA